MKKIFFLLAFIFSFSLYSQVGVGTTTPDGSSALDIYSTDKGILIPRLTLAQRDLISTPADGLLIYCLDCSPKGFYHFNGITWITQSTNNIYNVDGILSSQRTVTLANNELRFSGSSPVAFGESVAHGASVRLNASTPVLNGRSLSLKYVSGGTSGSISGDYSMIQSEYNSHGYTPIALNPKAANVGIGTINPIAKFTVDGLNDNPTSGIPNTTQAYNDLYFTSSGNLGIGWPSPTAKLEINTGESSLIKLHNKDAYTPNAIGNGLWISSGNNGTEIITADSYEPNGYGDIRFKTGDNFENATSKMIIREEGGVMVGRVRSYTRFTVDGANDNHDDVPNNLMAKNDFNVDQNGYVGIGTFYPTSNLTVNGSVAGTIRTMTSGTVQSDDYTILVGGNITLPSPNGCNGRLYVLINNSTTTRTVTGTLRNAGANANITSISLTNVDGRRSITVQSDGSVWWIIATN